MVLCLSFPMAPARADLAVGQRFPDLTFSGAPSAEDRMFLGLTKPGPFSLKDIKAKYTLLEIFSDTCPHCILEAPKANRLARLIEENPKLRGKPGEIAGLIMLGVGFYVKPAALEVWRIKRDIAFPLVPDPQALVGKALDIPGVPVYAVLDRQGRVVFMHAGAMGNPRKFLRQIIEAINY